MDLWNVGILPQHPEDLDLNLHRRENLKSRVKNVILKYTHEGDMYKTSQNGPTLKFVLYGWPTSRLMRLSRDTLGTNRDIGWHKFVMLNDFGLQLMFSVIRIHSQVE